MLNRMFVICINLFRANIPILYPLKTPENLWFSDVSKGYKMGALARNGLIINKYNHYNYQRY